MPAYPCFFKGTLKEFLKKSTKSKMITLIKTEKIPVLNILFLV